ncbi:MAG: DUF1294 domain-containing protein [Muribaculum sp.]|nr:DUF1294 domain-containing protein [Muribaculum sp.]
MKFYITLFLILYFLAANVIAFALMGIDKRRAVRREWRISEKTLFLSALLGGSLGAVWGMRYFRHKTRHWYFAYGLPAILAMQTAAAFYFLIR